MSIARRIFLKSATLTIFSAGVAFGAVKLVLGQGRRPIVDNEPKASTLPGGPTVETEFPIPFEAQDDPVLFFTQDTFSPYVGDIFQAPNSVGLMASLKLVSVTQYKVRASTRISTKKTRQPISFSLLFTSDERLPQFTSIHKLRHPALGQFDVFLSPRELEGGIYIYEAVFNHLQ